MQTKCVCPKCGDVVKTYSINNFRHCGTQFDVKNNLLAGEDAKYQKMVEKEGKKVPHTKEEPVAKIIEKVEEKKNDTPVVEPIIVEKVVEPEVQPKVKTSRKKKKSEIVEKTKKEIPTEDVYSFGFFE